MYRMAILLSTAAAFAIAAAAAPSVPSAAGSQQVQPQVPPGSGGFQLPKCKNPDPAIVSLTIAKTGQPKQIVITMVVNNIGIGAWHEWPVAPYPKDFLSLHLYEIAHPIYDGTWPLPVDAAPGAQMLSITTPPITADFKQPIQIQPVRAILSLYPANHKSPYVQLACSGGSYDPVTTNDGIELTPAAFNTFMNGPEQSHTWHP